MFKGIAASKGYAIGRVYLKVNEEVIIDEENKESASKEIEKLENALVKTKGELEAIRDRTKEEVGEEEALVFDAHIMILDDPEFIGAIKNGIEDEEKSAMKSLKDVTESFVEIFASMDDEYMRERASDVKDVSNRIMMSLAGIITSLDVKEKNTVVVAHDLTPSDTASLDKNKVAGFLTDVGGRTSHTAIMARTLEIPAVVGMENITSNVKHGDYIIIDGVKGEVIVNPSSEVLMEYDRLKENYLLEKQKLLSLKDVVTTTKDGKRVEVSANIGKPQDLDGAIENGAEGVGLYRTEFLYMDRKEMPKEDEQFEAYKTVLERMNPKPVVIRTLDIGGDKKLSYLPLPEEMNPFLGYRAIRLCLDRPEIFKIQLRALLRASVYGNLRVMFPMISKIEEYNEAMKIVEECKAELKNEGIEYSEDIQWGIMVEIPSAAVMADKLAEYVDFFSIGTNDLIQYTLAADRMSEKVSYLYDPMNPAVLRLIKMTIDGAHSKGKWCGMCGEMAGDEEAIPVLLEMGLDEFSMSASSILPAKNIITQWERK